MSQLHIDLQETQLNKFKSAVKILGYHTMSSYIRVCIRKAINEAEKIDQSAS